MTDRRTLAAVFLFSLFSVVLSLSWLIFTIGDAGLIFTETIYQFILTVTCLSFFILVISLHKLLFDIRLKMNEVKEKEKNIRDCYQYHQLLNPPDTDMNN